MTLARGGGQVIQMALVLILARALSVEEFGIFGLGISVASILALFVAFGINYMAIRDVAAEPQNASFVLQNGLIVRAVVVIPSLGVLWLSIHYTYSPHVRAAIILACFALVMQVISEFLCGLLNGLGRITLTAAGWFGYYFLLLILYITGIALGRKSASDMFLLRALAGAVLVFVLFPVVLHFIEWRPRWDPSGLWKFSRRALPYGLLDVGGFLFITIDSVMISLWQSPQALGYYQAAQKALLALDGMSQAAVLSFLPALSQLFVSSQSNWRSWTIRYVRYTAECAQAIGLTLGILGPSIAPVLFGARYADTGKLLSVFGFVIPLRVINAALSNSLMSSERVSIHTRAVWIAAVAQCGITFWLLRAYGVIGAAYSAIITSAIVSVQLLWAHREDLMNCSEDAFDLLKTVVAGVIMVVIAFSLENWVNPWISCIAGLTIYSVLLVWMGQFGRMELLWLRKAIGGGSPKEDMYILEDAPTHSADIL